MVPVAKAGLNVPAFKARPARLSLFDMRVMAMVYVCVVTPSCAVTTTLMLFRPLANTIGPDAVLLATAVPLTVIVAVASSNAGVTVTDEVALGTVEVYENVLKAKAGESVAVFTDKLDK